MWVSTDEYPVCMGHPLHCPTPHSLFPQSSSSGHAYARIVNNGLTLFLLSFKPQTFFVHYLPQSTETHSCITKNELCPLICTHCLHWFTTQFNKKNCQSNKLRMLFTWHSSPSFWLVLSTRLWWKKQTTV